LLLWVRSAGHAATETLATMFWINFDVVHDETIVFSRLTSTPLNRDHEKRLPDVLHHELNRCGTYSRDELKAAVFDVGVFTLGDVEVLSRCASYLR
jgi:hypothetical protein